MKKRIYKITAILLTMALFLGGCGSAKSSQDSASATTQTTSEKSDDTFKTAEAPQIDGLTYESTMDLTYAQEFDVFYYKEGYKLIDVHEGRQYLIVPEGKEAPKGLDSDIVVIHQPVQNIYMAATAIMSLFDALDAIDTVKFSGLEASGWYIESAKKAMESGAMTFAGKYSEPDYEMLVDEDCDLDKMQELEKEFLALGAILGKHPYDAFIRFRTLGRHHASGLYSPAYQCVCIDVRSPSSYVHEFLHMYDHFHGMLSEGYDFKEIRLQYEACLQEYLSDCEDPDLKARLNGNSKYNLDYYLVPTEVFARCEELYFTRFRGVDNSLLKFERGFDYPENEKLLELIKKYYDQHFLTEEISL